MLPAIFLLTTAQNKIQYPMAPHADQVDDYAGVKVADPFRPLENSDSPETRAWIEAENKITFGYLDALPGRDTLKARLSKMWNYERFGLPAKEGSRYFYVHNDGLQNQSPLFVAESLKAKPRLLLDPNTLSKDGTVALGPYVISRDGKYLAYSIQVAGSDWQEWHVRNVVTGKDTSDDVKWSKFSTGAWKKDRSGFFYCRYAEPKGKALEEATYFHKVYFHKLGTPQSADQLIYERKDHKDWGFDTQVTDDGRYLLIPAVQGTAREVRYFYKDLGLNGPVKPLLDKGDAYYAFLGNVGSKFYFQTEKNAQLSKVIRLDVRHPDNQTDIVPEAKATLSSATIVGYRLFLNYLLDAHTEIQVRDLNGKLETKVELPGIGSAGGFGGHITDKETFFNFTSYTIPTTIYHYDIANAKSTVFHRNKVSFDPKPYVTEEVFFKSKDGTRVPMFLTHRKGIKLDGSNPTLMYGYGGFAVNETPYFSVPVALWLELGGVYADVVLRGGSEYGEAWHRAGMLKNKQNVFDDFIAAGEWLISHKYTSTPKLAINGASNGGLLIGAMLTQRPELWGAAIPEVGVMDMLRFNKFTIGYAWMSDYGNPDTKEGFSYISKYSPLQNLKPGTVYPPTLILTADHDDRVVPAHSFKFAATMQQDQAGEAPVLIRIETRAGHGGGKPISKIIEEYADKYAFLMKNLKMRMP